jgi:hypothetical protein
VTESAYDREIRIAADELIKRHGTRANTVAADWANAARDRGHQANYEFWQWVCMDLNERIIRDTLKREKPN